MPRPPLHPNCRCKLMEILDVGQVMRERLAASGGEQAFAYFSGGGEGQQPLAPLSEPSEEEEEGRPAGATEEPGWETPDDEAGEGEQQAEVETFKDPIFGLTWRRGFILNGPI
ncbi:MAG: hypothetical protein C4525_01855 [Desulfarculus sp.]|nr:MAG: hypothetical protein C4525_01855 [Desulfarculus sp.]